MKDLFLSIPKVCQASSNSYSNFISVSMGDKSRSYPPKQVFFRVQLIVGHVKDYPRPKCGHTWPVLPVDKIPQTTKTWPRFAKT